MDSKRTAEKCALQGLIQRLVDEWLEKKGLKEEDGIPREGAMKYVELEEMFSEKHLKMINNSFGGTKHFLKVYMGRIFHCGPSEFWSC